MKITHIRNATFLLEYANERFLFDPMLAEKERYPGFPDTLNSFKRNPLVDLPFKFNTIKDNIDHVVVSHTHLDHWDEVAIEEIDKQQSIFVQNIDDNKILSEQGFTNLTTIDDQIVTNAGTKVLKTECQHGSDAAYADPEVAEFLGASSGFIFKNDKEKSVYYIGDTIWTEEVENTLKLHKPDIIMVNAGDAQIDQYDSIIMGKKDMLRIHAACPEAIILPIHMEAVNHCSVSRQELKDYVQQNNISSFVKILSDGESSLF